MILSIVVIMPINCDLVEFVKTEKPNDLHATKFVGSILVKFLIKYLIRKLF